MADQSAAEAAYEWAQEEIARVQSAGETTLNFDREETHALTTLPPELANLTALTTLDLTNTQLTDLSQIPPLLNLAILRLSNIQVSDLSGLPVFPALTDLPLNATQVRDLSPLTRMRTLEFVNLRVTSVTDLAPLAKLPKLEDVWLDDSLALDLRPLADLDKLGTSGADGLTFANTKATEVDPELKRLSEIADDKDRTDQTRAYLKTLPPWPEPLPSPPYPKAPRPEPDPLVSVTTRDGKLEIDPTSPKEQEREERLKRVLHERLKSQARALCDRSGNQFFRLNARARALEKLADVDFEDLDLLLLHLAVDDIREMEALGREDDESGDFPPEVKIALADVLGTGPGLTLGHPDVDLLVERANRRRSSPPVPQSELDAHDALSDAVTNAPEAAGDRLMEIEKAVKGSESAEDRELQKSTNRGLLWTIAVIGGGGAATAVAGDVAIQLFSEPIVTFIKSNWTVLQKVAATFGPEFLDWYARAFLWMKDLFKLP